MYEVPRLATVAVTRVSATPAMPARPEPRKNVMRSVDPRVETPTVSARSRFCTVARIRRPSARVLQHRRDVGQAADGDQDR